jgi:hypothetical protein
MAKRGRPPKKTHAQLVEEELAKANIVPKGYEMDAALEVGAEARLLANIARRMSEVMVRILQGLEQPGWVESARPKDQTVMLAILMAEIRRIADYTKGMPAGAAAVPTSDEVRSIIEGLPARMKKIGLVAEESDGTIHFRTWQRDGDGDRGRPDSSREQEVEAERDLRRILSAGDVSDVQEPEGGQGVEEDEDDEGDGGVPLSAGDSDDIGFDDPGGDPDTEGEHPDALR